ncbi:MAG: hypothetical protein ACFFAE_16670 [Candidatus Hodarchaeota archaeon]
MRYCVNCGSIAQADDRYCARCGFILRDRPGVSPPPIEVASSQAPVPVNFVAKTRSHPRSQNNGYSALGLGVIFILLGLFLGMLFLCPWFIGDIAFTFGSLGGKFGELGGKFGELGGAFGSAFGELGGDFGRMGGEFGRSFGGAFGNFGGRFGPTLLRVLVVVSIFACFLIPGIIILVRSRQRNHSRNSIHWE